MLDFHPTLAYRVTADLYRWFLVAYGTSAIARMGVEAYQQIVIQGAAWYDVPTAAFAVLELGFIPHMLLSLAAAEVLNMVFGAIIKERARQRGRAEGRAEAHAENNREWVEWLRRKAEAEANGESFNEPSPAERSAEPKS